MFNIKRYYKTAITFTIIAVHLFIGSSFLEAAPSYKVMLSTKSKGYPKTLKKNLDHPYNISETVLKKILSELYYIKKKGGKGWQNEKRIFSNYFVKNASVKIKKAFGKASPKQKIVVTEISSKGETVCYIFLKAKTLHFRFAKIQGTSRIHSKWKIQPKSFQRYYKHPKKSFSLSFLKRKRHKDYTWITISLLDIEEAYQSDSNSSRDTEITPKNKVKKRSTSASKNRTNQLNKLERMNSLKGAYDSELINKREYRKKAMSLLKSPAKVRMTLRDELIFLKILKNEGFISEDYFEQRKDTLLENL